MIITSMVLYGPVWMPHWCNEVQLVITNDQAVKARDCSRRVVSSYMTCLSIALYIIGTYMQPNSLSVLLDLDKHAPGLRKLDAALRCGVCSEFYDASVTRTRGHCICSLVRAVNMPRKAFIESNPVHIVRVAISVRSRNAQVVERQRMKVI